MLEKLTGEQLDVLDLHSRRKVETNQFDLFGPRNGYKRDKYIVTTPRGINLLMHPVEGVVLTMVIVAGGKPVRFEDFREQIPFGKQGMELRTYHLFSYVGGINRGLGAFGIGALGNRPIVGSDHAYFLNQLFRSPSR